MLGTIDSSRLRDAATLACDWLVGVAQVQGRDLPSDTRDSMGHGYRDWRGAIRGEYSAATRQWGFFCPVWHTAQAAKSLILAARRLGQPRFLAAAQRGIGFVLDKQIWDPAHADHGLILAYEDFADKVNTSAVMESLHGVMLAADEAGSGEGWARAEAAGDFLLRRLYLPEHGVFRDAYDPQAHAAVVPNPFRTRNDIGGRPLLEDGVFAKLYARTGRRDFLDAQIRVSEALVAHQRPPGNWLDYGPCNAAKGSFHPRHTYWWGLPLLDTWRHTRRREFLDTAIAAGEFCRRAIRPDGGWIRGLYLDNRTDSFGHATSGSACAAILWLALHRATGDGAWLEPAATALDYCMKVQFVRPADANLRGAVLEKVLPPDGTDRSPYHLRDLGTIFFVTAATAWLALAEEGP